MKLTAEIQTNPGPNARFVAEIVLQRSEVYGPGYWGAHFGWWLMRPFRKWLWDYENDPGKDWRLFRLRLAGFEVVWERRRK